MTVLANVLWILAVPAFLGAALRARRKREWTVLTAAGFGLLLAVCALERSWFGAGYNAVMLAVVAGTGWHGRRGRERA